MKNLKSRIMEIQDELSINEHSKRVIGYGEDGYIQLTIKEFNKIKKCLEESLINIERTKTLMESLKNEITITQEDIDYYAEQKSNIKSLEMFKTQTNRS